MVQKEREREGERREEKEIWTKEIKIGERKGKVMEKF